MFFFCGPPKPESPLPGSEVQISKTESEWMADLDSSVWNVRTEAILELSSHPSPTHLPKLRALLKTDPNPNVRGTAAIALGQRKDIESTPLVLELLDPKLGVSPDIVLDALSRMGDRRGASPILKFLDSEEHSLRLQTVETLATLNEPSVGNTILEMAKKCKDLEKKKTYAMILGRLRVKQSEDWLISLANQAPPSPTLAATYLALGRIRSQKGVPILTKAIGMDFDKGRENATQALIEIKDPRALPDLLIYLESSQKEIRYLAANVLIEVPNDTLYTKCIQILEESKTQSLGVASYILGRGKVDSARLKIEDALKNPSNPEREEMAQALGWIRNPKSIPVLISVLEESSGEGRYGAAWALGVIGDPQGFSALEKASGSSDFRLASIATESLGNFSIPELIPLMEKRISQNKNISVFAMRVIANVPGEKASQSLRKYARTGDPTLFSPAIESLGLRKNPEEIPFLIEILKEKDASKNRITIAALTQLTGKRFFSSQEWILWYEGQGK